MIDLSKISSRAPKSLSKKEAKKKIKEFQVELAGLHKKMYAEGKNSLLIILQGMDASGKDGATREVIRYTYPMGTETHGFKKPTELEFNHDFLWRLHNKVPQKGFITLFNRSYYEDVLIQRVEKWISPERVVQRFKHINNFESLLLEENNTHVLKFYLHVSKDEQLERLEERKTNPDKKWKHNDGDFETRAKWDDYRIAYQDLFDKCSETAPWHIIPSDQNWFKVYSVLKIVVEKLRSLNPKFPQPF